MTDDRIRIAPEEAAKLSGIPGQHAADSHTEVWIGPGALYCAIVRGPMGGMNGYVRLPERYRGRKLAGEEDISYEEVDVHGGITWGPDEGLWLGFDTGHYCDVWGDPDLPESDHEREMRAAGHESLLGTTLRAAMKSQDADYLIVWTKEKMREEVNHFAEQLAEWCERHPDAHGTKTPEERREETRAKMRRFSALKQAGVSDEEAMREVWEVEDWPEDAPPIDLPTASDGPPDLG